MSDDTPTTEHVRAQYARQENYDFYYEGDLYLTPDGQLSAAKFDRWLAQHDAEIVKATEERIIELLKATNGFDIDENAIALIKGENE